jgi:hypothetical protein
MDKIEPSDQSERKSYRLFSPPAGETGDSERKRAWKGESFSFRDFLDIINPLQHLPVVSTLYRWVTGDTIGAMPRMIGDALYGGPVGFVAGLVNAEVKQESGKDVGEQVIALLGGDSAAPDAAPKTIAAKDSALVSGTAPAGEAARAEPAATSTVAAASGAAPASSSPIAATPASVAAPTGPHAIPAMAASDPNDPRAIFLARTNMLHRQLAADSGSLPGRALSNKVVPLQGIAIPAGLMRDGAPSAQATPSNPPIAISQQMMDALEKYTRLQQQRESKAEPGRGAQVDLSQ